MRNLIVFGDSFNALNKEYKGTHWSEIISEKFNLNLISLARPGCSTKYVIFQILEALKYPGSIIIGSHASSFERVEIATKEMGIICPNIDITSFENFKMDKEESFIKSVNLFTLQNDATISDNIKQVLLTTIPTGINRHIDMWGMFYALTKLKQQHANFIYISNVLFKEFDLFDDSELLSEFGDEHVMTKDELCFADYYVDRDVNKDFIDPGYHTTFDSQITIANIIENKLKKQGLL